MTNGIQQTITNQNAPTLLIASSSLDCSNSPTKPNTMNSNSNSSKSTKSQRSVSFAESPLIFQMHESMSDDEKRACWYTAEESILIKQQALAIVARQGSIDASVDDDVRGLELITSRGGILTKSRDSIQAVLSEQQAPRRDATSVQMAYERQTHFRKRIAHLAALQDAQQAYPERFPTANSVPVSPPSSPRRSSSPCHETTQTSRVASRRRARYSRISQHVVAPLIVN